MLVESRQIFTLFYLRDLKEVTYPDADLISIYKKIEAYLYAWRMCLMLQNLGFIL